MKFFFIKDKVDQGDVRIEHLGTEDMWVDVLTKPKQGKSFRKDRMKLMNCPLNWQEPGVTAPQSRGAGVTMAPKTDLHEHKLKVQVGGERRKPPQKALAIILQ